MSLRDETNDPVPPSAAVAQKKYRSPYAFVFILVFGMSALILGCIQNFDCNTVSIPQHNTTSGTPGTLDSGPFLYRFDGVQATFSNGTVDTSLKIFEICRSYTSVEEDLKLARIYDAKLWISEANRDINSVQAMAIVACILGSLTMICVCTSSNCGVTCLLQWKIYGLFLFLTSLFQGLSLLILKTAICLDNPLLKVIEEHEDIFGQMWKTFASECEMSVGAKCGIASTVLWFAAGVMVCIKNPPGRYKEDCLTHTLQVSQAQASNQRMERIMRIEEYERKRLAMQEDKRKLENQMVARMPYVNQETTRTLNLIEKPKDESIESLISPEKAEIFHSTIQEHPHGVEE